QISVLLRRQSIVTKDGIAHAISDEFCRDFERLFSFVLTQSQKDVIREVAKDLKSNSPMHRLLQGDVGCGKTVVAFFGCLASVRNGYQAAIMAPTEILARQHYENLVKTIAGSPFRDIRPCLLISDLDVKSRAQALAAIQEGAIDIVVGTHALIQDAVNFRSLSFVVIDEQHKFGVRQRALLSAKGKNPDVLVMTATPIPRTLCLTLYGDLDVSTISEIPPGRGSLCTTLFAQQDAGKAYEIVRQAVARGEQTYIVYPIIDESEDLDLKSAQEMYKTLQKGELKGFRLGLLHGQMKKQQTQDVMRQFLNKELDVLVATTVLEVGVDVPNATVMVVEHADRFGLAQLHQLRGRIGRGALDAQCVLVADLATPQAQARLEVLLSTRDGFQIAQQDLLIRGPGEFFGRHQHGLNELRIANPQTQLDILEEARQEAIGILAKDPKLSDVNHAIIQKTILKRYPSYLGNILSG
ncbi:MAG TPA: ATP-dependent DNA helicase RecG, partial [Candidatus Omnitrophota bacterium]|nr:ATP-dependent DNA helicase RecG [Candidatus Omnitrophota bacterium]